MSTPNDATLRQIAAADPVASTWLSANAGSGKTRVLTDRVARMLLGGVPPQRILCLTYTKAAAAEMQNRLFSRLGDWAMKDDIALRKDLAELGETVISPKALAHARTLFARAIETPGGLKIQTIHSFCASVLRRFPLEAGVSPQFTEIDDRAQQNLVRDLIDEIADGPEGDVLDGIARFYGGDDLMGLCGEIAKHRETMMAPVSTADINGWFGLPAGFGEADVLGEVFLGGEGALLDAVAIAMEASDKATDQKQATILRTITGPSMEALVALESVVLFGATAKAGPFSAKIGSVPTKGVQKSMGPELEAFNDLMGRVERGRGLRVALQAARKTAALYAFAQVFLPAYAERKMLLGMLDFDDLVQKAYRLLTDSKLAQWVLYRLDGGIDHILVDEAQDTSPEQWRVIRRLAEEFTSGEGAREDTPRTIFAVGDPKQSIYSFQGADPAEFERMRLHFEAAYDALGLPLRESSLDYSFRSTRAVLSLVDQTFAATGGRGLHGASFHLPFFEQMPGRVDLWAPEPKADAAEDDDWTVTDDVLAQDHHDLRLARKIADQIKALCETGSIPGKNGEMRRITPGDFMVLVQKRSGIYKEIIAACKAVGVEIAGADRLKLEAEMAVRDLTALLRFLALPDDDLSLACVLRSPICGWSEQQLYDLAQGRARKQLWRELEQRAADFPETHAMLRDLRDSADFLRPYDLIERILIRHDARRRILARLGQEATDGIDVLLSQALSYERSEIPSLTGFLEWIGTGDVEVKRQLDSAGDRVRVMTVHGAKGLEAPIVILPDTGKRRDDSGRGQLVSLPDGPVVWKTAQAEAPAQMLAALEAKKEADEDERRRLLYVALTRAETWLIVCAAGDVGAGEDSWHAIVETGMRAADASELSTPTGPGLRLEHGDWSGAVVEQEVAKSPVIETPFWAMTAPSPAMVAPEVLTPTGLGGPKALPGDSFAPVDEEAALRRGRQIHRLFEFLPVYPQGEWDEIAGELLGHGPDAAGPDELAELLAEARIVLSDPALAYLFSPTTLAEVDISADLAELSGQRLRGTIDRLIVEPGRVLAIDFKSNAVMPDRPEDVPLGLVRQMGAYQAALEATYPDRVVEVALLWTKTGQLMPLKRDIVRQALYDTPTS